MSLITGSKGAYAKLEGEETDHAPEKSVQVVTHEVRDDTHNPHNTHEGFDDEHDAAAFVPEPLPPKKHSRWYRNIRWTFLTVYQRLALIVLIPNFVMMIWLCTQEGTFSSPTRLSTPVAANITLTVLIRNEHVINFSTLR